MLLPTSKNSVLLPLFDVDSDEVEFILAAGALVVIMVTLVGGVGGAPTLSRAS